MAMSDRDEFAKAALAALIAEPPWADGGVATIHAWAKDYKGSDPCGRFAFAAYKMADAMLAARTQNPEAA